jgi:hypothetical protein
VHGRVGEQQLGAGGLSNHHAAQGRGRGAKGSKKGAVVASEMQHHQRDVTSTLFRIDASMLTAVKPQLARRSCSQFGVMEHGCCVLAVRLCTPRVSKTHACNSSVQMPASFKQARKHVSAQSQLPQPNSL